MRVAVFTDIHGNLPAREASLAATDAIGVDQSYCGGRPGRIRTKPQRGSCAHRRPGDPDNLRQP
jgi:hypothetical protein